MVQPLIMLFLAEIYKCFHVQTQVLMINCGTIKLEFYFISIGYHIFLHWKCNTRVLSLYLIISLLFSCNWKLKICKMISCDYIFQVSQYPFLKDSIGIETPIQWKTMNAKMMTVWTSLNLYVIKMRNVFYLSHSFLPSKNNDTVIVSFRFFQLFSGMVIQIKTLKKRGGSW